MWPFLRDRQRQKEREAIGEDQAPAFYAPKSGKVLVPAKVRVTVTSEGHVSINGVGQRAVDPGVHDYIVREP